MSDRELLELAAKAAGMPHAWAPVLEAMLYVEDGGKGSKWNPLTDDGDALRLAVKLRIIVTFSSANGKRNVIACQRLGPDSVEAEGDDPLAATRRAIVRAAAAIAQDGGART